MQFRTVIPISKTPNPIDYKSKVIAIGSCFAENMANKFDYFKFQNQTNPFGIIFNPVSIERIVKRSIKKESYTEKDVFFHNERWHCFEVHSDLSDANLEELLANLNKTLAQTYQQIQEATHFIITYGTAWVYRNNESDQIVANCHKVPQKQFSKELLSVEEVQKSIQNTMDLIQSLNPHVNFIYTVSPVRHIKDGFVENQWSKSNLLAALHAVLNAENSIGKTDYFPSYEIMMDELRDYRFYTQDMLHPNAMAIDYIWERFGEHYIAENSCSMMQEISEIQKSLAHRSFNPQSEQHLKFVSKLTQRISIVEGKWPHIHF